MKSSTEIYRIVVSWKLTKGSKEHFTSIIKVEELAKQEISVKQVGDSNPKMHATSFLETSVDFQRTSPLLF
jgi:hypothetical protein